MFQTLSLQTAAASQTPQFFRSSSPFGSVDAKVADDSGHPTTLRVEIREEFVDRLAI